MPNGKTHKTVGTACGALAAASRTRPEDGEANLFIAIGGGVGGYIASRWPDLWEPAICPNHRQIAHSVVAGGSLLTYAIRVVPEWEARWRAVAIDASERRLAPSTPQADQMLLSIVEIFAWVMVGLLAGLAAGYLSHLALDGCTPAGLPLIGLCGPASGA